MDISIDMGKLIELIRNDQGFRKMDKVFVFVLCWILKSLNKLCCTVEINKYLFCDWISNWNLRQNNKWGVSEYTLKLYHVSQNSYFVYPRGWSYFYRMLSFKFCLIILLKFYWNTSLLKSSYAKDFLNTF